jgi:hypothetical protein
MHGFNVKSELLAAGAIALLAEAVAVILFFASSFVWLAIYATAGAQ